MTKVRWGILGCGDVTEVKSGPALQKAQNSSLVAVMRRDAAKAADYAARHGVPKHYSDAQALIDDADVDAVYVATPPSSHFELALRVAAARKPCLVEKPMARVFGECQMMVGAFERAGVPLFVAHYRRAQPRFLRVRELVRSGAVGRPTSARVEHATPILRGDASTTWRVDPAVAGGGLFFDLASHALDLLDFFLGPIVSAHGEARNTGGVYAAEDVVAASFAFKSGAVGTGLWNFNAGHKADGIVITGTDGEIEVPVFSSGPIIVRTGDRTQTIAFDQIPHVHQPFIQTVVDELLGRGRCESHGQDGARTAWVMDQCVARFDLT
jgi:predicted dehydrogenase